MKKSCQVVTIAGNGETGQKDRKSLESILGHPTLICCSNDGVLYVSDLTRSMIKKLENNQLTIVAGNGKKGFKDGNALEAMFHDPWGLCISNDGKIYVSDYYNRRVRMVYKDQVITIAGNGKEGFKDGKAHKSRFSHPYAICVSNDNKIYVLDLNNSRIRMIYDNYVTTIAGNGQAGFKDGNALEAMFSFPYSMCASNDGRIYVNDGNNNRIRMIYNDQMTTIAGNGHSGLKDGKALEASFSYPHGICISKDGRIYVSDLSNQRIRMIYNNHVLTIAGNGQKGFQDGNALESMFNDPTSICCSNDGKLYIFDQHNYRIRMIDNIQVPINIQKSPFGFGLLLDFQGVLCDRQVSINGTNYHLHTKFMNVRCPQLFDQEYLILLEKSKISTQSISLFINFLYSNKLGDRYDQSYDFDQICTSLAITNIFELVFLFDLFDLCKWMIDDLKNVYKEKLKDILDGDIKSRRKSLVESLSFFSDLKELIKTKLQFTTTTFNETEYCYSILTSELSKRRDINEERFFRDFSDQSTNKELLLSNINQGLLLDTDKPKKVGYQSEVVLELELTDLAMLAFQKTNFCTKNDKIESKLKSLEHHLNEWLEPDFVIMLPNDDTEYHVHKLILSGRWKYFKMMIESGFKETKDNRMRLSDDWNKSRLSKFIKYIYLAEIDFEELQDIEWLIQNAKLYAITIEETTKDDQSNNNPVKNTGSMKQSMATSSNSTQTSQTGAYGFEELFEHCFRILSNTRKTN